MSKKKFFLGKSAIFETFRKEIQAMATKILAADDDRNICELLKLYLENEGYEVKCAQNGAEAVDMFKLYEPDLVLLDVMMPRKDGWQDSDLLIARLRVRNNSFEDEIWDEEYRQYIIDNGLTPADLKNTLHVFGIPEEVPYTGDKIIFRR